MEYTVYKGNTKLTVRLLTSPFKVLFRSTGFHPRLLSWCQILGVAVPASYTCIFFLVMSCACDWFCVPVTHPAAWSDVTCLIKCHATLTCWKWWKSVRNLNLPCLFFLLQIKVCWFASPNCELFPLPELFSPQHLFSLWKPFSIDLNWLVQKSLVSSMQIVTVHLLWAAKQYQRMLLCRCALCIFQDMSPRIDIRSDLAFRV